MQGILMILPQSKTFHVIKSRLDCVNITNFSLPFINDEDDNDMSEEQIKQQVISCLATFET